jgi:aryl-alcohol dehydrogenase-like predicted oxidoreductase
MRYRALGGSGLRISVLGVGCSHWGTRVESATAERLARTALDHGVTVFDTADSYGRGASEEALGRALRGVRDRAVVATKVRWPTGDGPNDRGASRVHIRAAVEASLRRLGTDRIDLYQIHAPDPVTPLEETFSVLADLVTQGKILYAGAAGLSGWELVDARWRAVTAGRAGYVSTQAPYSLLDRSAERELLPAARRHGIGVLAILVLARGFLAGTFDDADPSAVDYRRRALLTPANRRLRAVVGEFAAARGLTAAQVALAAIADRPGVSAVVVGASGPAQLAANAELLARPALSEEDVAALFADLDPRAEEEP